MTGPRTPIALFLAGMVVAAGLVVGNGWVQYNLGLRFVFVALGAAVGSVYLAGLTARRRVEPRAPVSSRRPATGRSPRKGGRQEAAAEEPGADMRTTMERQAALAACGLAAWAVLSALTSAAPAVALLGRFTTTTGAVFIVACLGLWAAGLSAGPAARDLVERALLGVALANTALVFVQSLVDLSSIRLGTFAGRPPGFFSNPVYLATVLIGAFWLALERCRLDRRWTLAVAALAAGIEVTGSRSGLALLGLAVAAAAVGGLRGRITIPGASARLGASALVVVTILGVGGGYALGRVTGHATSSGRAVGQASAGIRPRLETWKQVPAEVARNPLFGVGPDRFRAASGRDRTVALARSEGPDRLFTDAHDIIAEYAVTIGVPGLLLWIAFVALAFRLVDWSNPLSGFAVLALASHLTEPQHVSATALAYVALGAAATTRRLRPPVPEAAVAVAAGVAGAVALVPAVGTNRLDASWPTVSAATSYSSTARHLLPWWEDAYSISALATVKAARVPGADRAALLARARSFGLTAAHREPDDPDQWNQLASFDFSQGDVAASISEYRRALADDPVSARALLGLSRDLLTQGDNADAIAPLRTLSRIEPDLPGLQTEIAQLGG